ncbi:MAG: DUF5011 domain-containing protein [Bacteroidetes bacterium]|nr:DUF5011 domain-containing protein [Bacteroidota bacterium]
MKYTLGLAAGALLLIAACKKEAKNVSETIKVQYPIIRLKGAEYNTIGLGGSFTDPGAEMFDSFAMANGWVAIEPTQSAVDPNTPGMYPIIYEGTNKYGFKSQAVRWVAVTPVPASEDISGTYFRTSNLQEISVSKVATGIYKVDNMGGVPGIPDYIFDTYFVQLTDTTLHYPEQPGPFGNTTSADEYIDKSPSDTMIGWRVMGPGFGTALRNFSRK